MIGSKIYQSLFKTSYCRISSGTISGTHPCRTPDLLLLMWMLGSLLLCGLPRQQLTAPCPLLGRRSARSESVSLSFR